MIQFDLPKDQSSILKVVGIGGGGGNAVNYMFGQEIEGVDFIICNTDAQALEQSRVPNKVQLGPELTQGLGAGANPEIGREATEESLEEIRRILEVNTKMAFITAGMGGGTGTGGAPIVAKVCKDLGILTVGIVTTPFQYEGKKRMAQALEGLDNLKQSVDTLLVISNDKLRRQFGNLTVKAAFAKADNILATAAKCITDVINSTGQINVDFADVCTVMRNGGVAILGSSVCEGENRAQNAIEQALNSPLLNDNDISGAKWILININSAEGEYEFTMDEVDTIQSYLLSKAGEDSDVILGLGYDNNLEKGIGVTLIATGFQDNDSRKVNEEKTAEDGREKKEILQLEPNDKKSEEQPVFVIRQPEKKEEVAAEVKKVEGKNEGLREEEVKAALKKEEPKEDQKEMQPLIVTPPAPVVEEDRSVVFFDLSDDEKEADEPDGVAPQSDRETFTLQPEEEEPNIRFDKPPAMPVSEKKDVKPAGVYVEKPRMQMPRVADKSKAGTGIQKSGTKDKDKEAGTEMKLVEKDTGEDENKQGQDEKQHDKQSEKQIVPPPAISATEVYSDEEEELRRRALDRIAKLRNLSYNRNTKDPNDDFESIPAYLRRNLELHNSIADVESFYSNYSVKSDDKDNIQISSLNSYLNGKNPD